MLSNCSFSTSVIVSSSDSSRAPMMISMSRSCEQVGGSGEEGVEVDQEKDERGISFDPLARAEKQHTALWNPPC